MTAPPGIGSVASIERDLEGWGGSRMRNCWKPLFIRRPERWGPSVESKIGWGEIAAGIHPGGSIPAGGAASAPGSSNSSQSFLKGRSAGRGISFTLEQDRFSRKTLKKKSSAGWLEEGRASRSCEMFPQLWLLSVPRLGGGLS